jgi:hypothetical protein
MGTPVRYCLSGHCVNGESRAPVLTVEDGSTVTFSLGRPPERAIADVSGAGGGKNQLHPATLMAYPGRITPGPHRITLALSWSDASGQWVFELLAK